MFGSKGDIFKFLPCAATLKEVECCVPVNHPPQAKVSTGGERMETGLCCVYNVTRGCRLNSKVTVVDSAREPLKVLKILIEGLARDGESSLWLTPLLFTPNIIRLFPFDFAYLDGGLRVIEGIALPPGIPLPQFNAQVASALVLPFNTFSSTGTCAGDRLIVCVEEDLDARIAEITESAAVPTPVVSADESLQVAKIPLLRTSTIRASSYPHFRLRKISSKLCRVSGARVWRPLCP